MKGHIRERSPGHWAIVIDVREPQTPDTRLVKHGNEPWAPSAGPGLRYTLCATPMQAC